MDKKTITFGDTKTEEHKFTVLKTQFQYIMWMLINDSI